MSADSKHQVTKTNFTLSTYNDREHCILHNVLTPEECSVLMQDSEKLGYTSLSDEYQASYRSNTRVMVTDKKLAKKIWKRVKSHIPREWTDKKTTWRAVDTNQDNISHHIRTATSNVRMGSAVSSPS